MDSDVERALQHAIGRANSAFATGLPSPDMSMDASRHHPKKRPVHRISGSPERQNDKKRKKTAHPVAPNTVSSAVNGLTLGATKTKGKRKDARTSPHPEASASAIHLFPLLGNPSSSEHPSQTLASTSENHLPAGQLTQDLYYPQAVRNFPSFHTEDNSFSQLNTNDDILRAFQDLDLTRLAGVLRGLDLPSSPPQSNAQLGDILHDDANGSFLDHIFSTPSNIGNKTNPTTTASSAQCTDPHKSSGTSGTSKRRSTKVSKPVPRPNPNIATMGPSIATPEHTDLLANKWLSASKLKTLVETEGLVYKKGKFSIMEEQALKAAIESYRVSNGLSAEQIIEVIFSKSKENTFWPEITASVPARPITAVYHHVHRTYHPLKSQGKWSADEDRALILAVENCGQAWQRVSDRVGRMAQDCRDRWKNHLVHRSEKQHGHWTKEEEEELTRIVTEATTKNGKTSDNDVFWVAVSQRMGNKRSRQQCRIKWTDSLSKTVKNSGKNPRWSKQDSFILVHKVASLEVRDDSEIDWKILPDSDWNLWSAHSMQRRWRSLKNSIKGHETMAFGEIVEILQQKHAELPSIREDDAPARSRIYPRKEPKSAELIDEEDDDQPVGDERRR